jgi:putative flippase GtrA
LIGLKNMSKAASNQSSKGSLAQFIMFNIVGLLNTFIDFLMFTILIWFGAYYLLAQVIAYGAGMINSFVLNSRYTFGKKGNEAPRPQQLNRSMRFIVWNGMILGVTLLLLMAFNEWWGLNEVVSKLIVTVVTVVLNFYGSKKWVFAAKGPQTESS